MKITGQIDIGVKIIQVDKLAEEFSLKAPRGSFIYSDPLNVLTKSGNKDDAWTRTTFRVMMMNILSWAITTLESSESDRAEIMENVFKSIETFKGGETSPEGRQAVKMLKEDCKIIGFVPQVTYIMHRERGDGSLDCFWEHPFSMPTILAKHKTLPILIISNGNIDFDDSRLKKMNSLNDVKIGNTYYTNSEHSTEKKHLNPSEDENEGIELEDFYIETQKGGIQGITG